MTSRFRTRGTLSASRRGPIRGRPSARSRSIAISTYLMTSSSRVHACIVVCCCLHYLVTCNIMECIRAYSVCCMLSKSTIIPHLPCFKHYRYGTVAKKGIILCTQ